MRFLFACGGTAGHVNPAVGVAGRIRELLPDSEILFIGALGKMEMELVPREGYEIRGVPVSNLSRSLSVEGIRQNLSPISSNPARRAGRSSRNLSRMSLSAPAGTSATRCCMRRQSSASPPSCTRATLNPALRHASWKSAWIRSWSALPRRGRTINTPKRSS